MHRKANRHALGCAGRLSIIVTVSLSSASPVCGKMLRKKLLKMSENSSTVQGKIFRKKKSSNQSQIFFCTLMNSDTVNHKEISLRSFLHL